MDTLYELSAVAVAMYHGLYFMPYTSLPTEVQADVAFKLFELGLKDFLTRSLHDIHMIKYLLSQSHKRSNLHKMLNSKKPASDEIILRDVTKLVRSELNRPCLCSSPSTCKHVHLGILFGDFLNEAGWYEDAIEVFTITLRLIQTQNDVRSIELALLCCGKIMRAQNGFCLFSNTRAMVECSIDMLYELPEDKRQTINKACIFAENSVLFFALSYFNEGFRHCMMSLREICKPDTSISTIIDVLRLCSKAFVVKRSYKIAQNLIELAVRLARDKFGEESVKYADTLIDYGFYLLSTDQSTLAVYIYEKTLEYRKELFGLDNLNVAIAHEDLAYACYVDEYNTGEFGAAFFHSTRAVKIFSQLVSKDHLLTSSSQRVRALVLEEMAIDSEDYKLSESYLSKALKLQKISLSLSLKAFGERNMQTAKHYGNLGRLYQTLKDFKMAEKMHLKAIQIKEDILGPDDQEVGQSVGQLASLYNYDMKKFEDAERLHLRAIDIGIKLFGLSYSALEYDYKGLIRIYYATQQYDKYQDYLSKLDHWHSIRQIREQNHSEPLDFIAKVSERLHPNDEILSIFDKCREEFPDVFKDISTLTIDKTLPSDWCSNSKNLTTSDH